MNKPIIVKIEGEDIEVKKLPIGRYAEILKAVKELPKHLSGIDELDKNTVLEKLPELIGVATPDIINIVSIATGIPSAKVQEYGLREMTDLVMAIFEVNEYQEVYTKIKKAMAQSKTEPQETATLTN